MDTLHSVMTGRTWKDFGKYQYCKLHYYTQKSNRFWKRGYWSNHLGNRKYHIRFVLCNIIRFNITRIFSALYVIDLVRFRQLAAGDRLRGQYQVINSTCLTF